MDRVKACSQELAILWRKGSKTSSLKFRAFLLGVFSPPLLQIPYVIMSLSMDITVMSIWQKTHPIRHAYEPIAAVFLWRTPTSDDLDKLFRSVACGVRAALAESFADNILELCLCLKNKFSKFLGVF